MASLVKRLTEKGLITPPSFLPDNIQYETAMGSMAYGVNTDESDEDIYGFAIALKEVTFPHLAGEIQGFDKEGKRFNQYEQHHIKFSDKKEYDIVIFNIVKYFRLCADGNPNMIDSLFTSAVCVKHSTHVGQLVRDNRKLFLSKKCWHTFKGYAYSQLHKMRIKTPSSPKRIATVEKYGYDVKYGYHLVRLINEVEQMMTEGDLDLLVNREQLKSIRRGEWTMEDIENYFTDKEKQLEKIYLESKAIPMKVRESEIKRLLLDCLEHHYGDLSSVCPQPDKYLKALKEIQLVTDRSLK